MTDNILSPFAGKPETHQIRDENGNPAFLVCPRELTPLRAMLADALGIGSAVVMGVGVLLVLDKLNNPTGGLVLALLVAPFAAYFPLKWGWRYALRKETEIMLTPDLFKVKTLLGWKTYDRKLAHSFSLVRHDKAQAERDRHEYAVRKGQAQGKVVRKTRYFGESFHLSYDCLGQRNDVATIFGKPEARAVLTRLKACDQVMDTQARMGEGAPLGPEDQWGDQPGDVPGA